MPIPSLLDHYILLAQTEGWGQYTRERLKQMAKDCPEMYRDYPQLVAQSLTTGPALASHTTLSLPTSSPSASTAPPIP
jgi:hypothetical protein